MAQRAARNHDVPSVESAAPVPPPALGLAPIDWFWAAWRHTPPLARPPSPAFDLHDALQRLRRVSNAVQFWLWDWSKAQIPTFPSREEAHFWLVARHPNSSQAITPAQLAERLEGQRFDGAFSGDEALALVADPPHAIAPITAALVAALCEPADFIPLAAKVNEEKRGAVAALLDGFRQYVLPYLDAAERDRLSQKLAGLLDPAQWPSDFYAAGPPAFYLAAMLGGHGDALLRLVESWPDDRFTRETWSDYYQRPQLIVFGLDAPRLVEAHARRLRLRLNKPDYVRAWLAHTELAALDVVRDGVLAEANKDAAAELTRALACADAPEAAPVMLELLHGSRAPQPARSWLEAHPQHAIAGLVPVAAGRGKLADAAGDWLRRLARRDHGGAIEAQAAALPPEGAARIREQVLAPARELPPPLDGATTPRWLSDALAAPLAGKRAAPAAWVLPSDLPPVTVGERRLSDAQVAALLGALQRSTLDAPHPLVTAVKRHASQPSLDAFAWAIFEQWLQESAPSKENWALQALGLLGGDAAALRLAPLVRAWPGESQHPRAVLGLECLRAIGTDTALMQISGIAQKVKFKGLQARAAACMERIARERNLGREQLEDRIVPACDLDARGERAFSFGPREFRFALGPGLKPMLRDAQGALKADLPKPNAKDDAALAAEAVAEWKLLKKQVGEVAKVQALRLEQAMVVGRRWPRAEFEALLVRHPLLTHLVRALIWGAYDDAGALAATFRVTEDQTYATSADDTYELAADAAVGIVHTLHLAEDERAAWGELLADYAIVPPFPQLGRPIQRLAPEESGATEITRFNDLTIPAATLVFGLDKLQWTRDTPADAGGFSGHSKPFPQANVTAVVQYEEGVGVGYIVDAPPQRLLYLAYVPGVRHPQMWPRYNDRLRLGDVDDVVVSETLSDIMAVMAKATP